MLLARVLADLIADAACTLVDLQFRAYRRAWLVWRMTRLWAWATLVTMRQPHAHPIAHLIARRRWTEVDALLAALDEPPQRP